MTLTTTRIGRALLTLFWRAKAIVISNGRAPVFIVGTGRSGTHLATETLISHRDLDDLTSGQENPFVFDEVVRYATGEHRDPDLLDLILDKYEILVRAATPRRLVDQCHPNLWLFRELSDAFPSAQFVAMLRNPYSVSYSMQHHPGVMQWIERWRELGVPNPFLGIREGEEATYERMTASEKCARRWAAHTVQIDRAKRELGNRMFLLVYEDLCREPEATSELLAEWLSCEERLHPPAIERSSLEKWRRLDRSSVVEIRETVASFCHTEGMSGETKCVVDRLMDTAT